MDSKFLTIIETYFYEILLLLYFHLLFIRDIKYRLLDFNINIKIYCCNNQLYFFYFNHQFEFI